jgi:enoyl-CoA hydratase/carnithine racemase
MQLHDIAFVGEGAGIGQIEAQIATSTLLGGASRLVSKIGAARAKEMVFSADIYYANTLLAWGLINKVYPNADVEAEARTYAHKLAASPTVAYHRTAQMPVGRRKNENVIHEADVEHADEVIE